MKKYYYSFIVAFCLLSCSLEQKEKDTTIVPVALSSPQKEILLSSFIDSVHTIRLELPDSLIFGGVSKVLFADHSIYVVDQRQDIVFRFDLNGRFANSVGTKGSGPGEYTELSSCFWGKDRLYIADLNTRRIYSYTQEGEFIDKFSFPFSLVYNDIIYLSDGYFLCHQLSSGNNKGIWIMNNEGEKEQTILKITDAFPFVFSGFSTLSVDASGIIYINEPPSGRFYTFNPVTGVLKNNLCLKSDIKMLSEFKGNNTALDIKEKNADCTMSINADHYIFSMWSIMEDKSMGRCIYSLYNNQTQEVTTFQYPDLDIPGVFSLGRYVSSNLPNALVSCFSDEYLKEYYPDEYKRFKMKENILILKKFIFK